MPSVLEGYGLSSTLPAKNTKFALQYPYCHSYAVHSISGVRSLDSIRFQSMFGTHSPKSLFDRTFFRVCFVLISNVTKTQWLTTNETPHSHRYSLSSFFFFQKFQWCAMKEDSWLFSFATTPCAYGLRFFPLFTFTASGCSMSAQKTKNKLKCFVDFGSDSRIQRSQTPIRTFDYRLACKMSSALVLVFSCFRVHKSLGARVR